MKLLNKRSLIVLASIGFFSIGTLNAIEDDSNPEYKLPVENVDETKNDRTPSTPEEERAIHEERLSQFPSELLQNAGLFDYKVDFRDYEYIPYVNRNANHFSIGYTPSGDEIKLEDQSTWLVALFDRTKVRSWKADHILYIKPATYTWLFYYDYVIQNRTTGESVDVKYLSGPLLNVPGSLNIANIDPTERVVVLDDGTAWYIHPTDISFRKWRVGDRLIVGVNHYWRMDQYAHILINTTYDAHLYCEARCISKP